MAQEQTNTAMPIVKVEDVPIVLGSTGRRLAWYVYGQYWECPYCGCHNKHFKDDYGKVSGSRLCVPCGADYDLD